MKIPRLLSTFLFITLYGIANSDTHASLLIGNYPASNDGLFSAIASSSGTFSKAAGFALPSGDDYTLDSVVLRLRVNNSGSTISVTLFGDVGGNPGGSALDSFAIPVLVNGVGDYVLIPTAPIILQDSTTYWIAATGNSPTADGVTWLAENPSVTPTGVATSAGFRFDNTGGFPPTLVSSIQNTYQVFGTSVPEPASVAFVELALLGVCLVRRRR